VEQERNDTVIATQGLRRVLSDTSVDRLGVLATTGGLTETAVDMKAAAKIHTCQFGKPACAYVASRSACTYMASRSA
jgi:hypothetical protein